MNPLNDSTRKHIQDIILKPSLFHLINKKDSLPDILTAESNGQTIMIEYQTINSRECTDS